MATYNGKSYSDTRNLNLRGGALGTGLLRWTPPQSGVPALWSSNPFSSTEYGLYLNSSGQLVFSSLGTATVLGDGSGGGGVPSWEQIFALDSTFSKTTVWTINNSSLNNQVLKLTNTGAGSGDVLVIDNGGTGYDIVGTAAWFVTKTGAATFLDVDTATLTNTTGNIILKASGAGTVTIGANTNTITMAKATTFSSTITVTDGLTDLISTSNVAAALRITNNTASTWGAAAASAGVAVIRSTSLTTGSLLRLQLTEGTLTTGNYVDCYDVTGGGLVFEVGKAGAVTIGGVAASNVLTITAGDAVMSDGSLTITDADNAASLSVTNDTATTANVVAIAGSGTFTGSTTGSFVTITPSGLTSGTAVYLVAAALDSGKGIHMVANALTTGEMLHLAHTTSVIADGGSMLRISSTSIDTGGATNGTLLDMSSTSQVAGSMVKLVAGAVTTGVLIDLSSTTGLTSGSLIRATSATAGAIATNGAISFRATGDFTSTSNMGYVSIAAAATAAGTIMSLTGGALTSGVGLYVADSSTGMTSGSLIRVSTGTTGAVATNGIVSITATGAYTSTSNCGLLQVVADSITTGATVVNISATAATTSVALRVVSSGTGLTSGSLAVFTSGTTGAIATNGAVSIRATGAYTSTSNVGFLDVLASATTAGTVVRIASSAAAQTATELLRVEASGFTTGYTGNVAAFISSSTTGASNVVAITSANSTAGTALLVTANSLTTGTAVRVTSSGTITNAGEGLVNIVATGMTSGSALKIDLTEATLNGGYYINCYDDTATGSVFLVGEDGAISNGTGTVNFGGAFILSGTETIAAGGTSTALSLTKSVHYVDADAGGDTFTLADGTAGQITTILMKSSTGTATITPANLAGGTSVTFNAAGDSVVLQFMDTDWYIIGGNSYAVV